MAFFSQEQSVPEKKERVAWCVLDGMREKYARRLIT
jgi:hypothetical protein